VVAPWEVGAGAALVFGLLVRARRAARATAVLVAAGVVAGAVRAAAAVDAHERARAEADRALPATARCSATAVVVSSPVAVRGTLRWDAELTEVSCDGADVGWTGRATLYGGPPDLARGDRAEVVATLAPPQRLWNTATGDPRPGEALRGTLRSGGALDVRVTRRGRG